MLTSDVVTFETVRTYVGGLVKPGQTITSMVVMVDVNQDDLFLLRVVGRKGNGFVSSAGVDTNQLVLR